MGKTRNKSRIKLPKRLLGVKIAKETRREIDGVLKGLPPATAEAVAQVLLDTLVSTLAARAEVPQHEVIQMFPSRESRARSRASDAT